MNRGHARCSREGGQAVKSLRSRGGHGCHNQAHPVAQHTKRVTKDGKLLAMGSLVIDGGLTARCAVVLSRGTIHALVIRVQTCGFTDVRLYNVPPHGAFRGFGAPQSIFALERHRTKWPQKVGLTPEEFRRSNVLHEVKTATSH